MEGRTLHRRGRAGGEPPAAEARPGDEGREAGRLQEIPGQHREGLRAVHPGTAGREKGPPGPYLHHRVRGDRAGGDREAVPAGKGALRLPGTPKFFSEYFIFVIIKLSIIKERL